MEVFLCLVAYLPLLVADSQKHPGYPLRTFVLPLSTLESFLNKSKKKAISLHDCAALYGVSLFVYTMSSLW